MVYENNNSIISLFCSNIGTFPSHLNITFYNQNYILLYLNNNCIDLRLLMHFVLNGACVFFFVCAVYFSVWILLLKDTIMYLFIGKLRVWVINKRENCFSTG